MRFIYVLLVLLICFVPEAFSQHFKIKRKKTSTAENNFNKCLPDSVSCRDCREPGDLIYDFSCKRLYQLNDTLGRVRITKTRQIKIRYGHEFRFSIININRYLYNINFVADDVNFGSEPSPLFETLFLGKTLPASDTEAANISKNSMSLLLWSGISGDNTMLNVADYTKLFKDAYDDFTKEYNKLLDDELRAYSYCAELNCNCGKTKFSTLSGQLDLLKQQYLVDSTALAIKIKALSEKETPTSNDKIELITLTGSAHLIDILFESIRRITGESLMQLVLFSNNQSRDHLTYVAPPIYPRGNRLELGFGISAKESKNDSAWKLSSMPLYTDSIGFDLPVRHKPFVSFSTGLFGAAADRFKNANHGWQTQLDSGIIDSDSQFRLVKGRKSPSPVGFAAMANMGITVWDNVMLGASLGVGMTIEEKPRTAYLAGFTIGLGDEKQFNITTGLIAMRVRVFNTDTYTYGTLYKEKETINYREVLQTGWFVAVTYSIFTPTNRKGLFSRSN